MEFQYTEKSFCLTGKKGLILQADQDHPMIYLGKGEDDISMRSGFFTVQDYLTERKAVAVERVRELTREETEAASLKKEDTIVDEKLPLGPVMCGYEVLFEDDLRLTFLISEDACTIDFSGDLKANRFWIRLRADKDEAVYGGGEQFSYLNMRGRNFPLWTSEPGVGRDKSTRVTYLSDKESGNGGDYYGTYFPQQTYVSSKDYYLHTFCTAYADFDFRHDDFHELQFWAIPERIYLQEGDNLLQTVSKMSGLLGRQEELPDFVYNGAVLGLQGGTRRVAELTQKSLDHGIKVAGLFCQDWCGNFMDPWLGKRLRWDFRWDPSLYPGLPEQMEKWQAENIRFLGYINPYLKEDSESYNKAKEAGVLLLNKEGEIYRINSGSIFFGMIDLSTPKGFDWYKDFIKRELLDFGLEGWMADFGEYVPADSCPASGEDPKIWHNRYPAEWARCNYEACKEAGKLGQIMYFMRSGATGSQRYTALQWQGDQSVDFTIHDGLASAIVGALSLTMSGYGLSHSDIGGYTSVFGNCRTKELFERWAEFAAFTPVMRTHECNRPDTNFQYYDDDDAMLHFARMIDIHEILVPYIKELVRENHETGIGCMRPLFLHYEEDEKCKSLQTEYLFGPDLLVAPIYTEGAEGREVYLPEDAWVGLFDGRVYACGEQYVKTPLGKPAVFYRQNSAYRELFEKVEKEFG